MLASEILNYLEKQHFKNYFSGIFSSDNVPKTIKDKHFIVINTDEKTGPGKHWYVVLRCHNLIECFDSLGVRNERKVFLSSHFRIKGLTHITFNSTQVQPDGSTLCGQYVLYFLFEQYHNLDYSFDHLLNEIIDNKVDENDKKVLNFIQDTP